jgi:hypothetical protein
LIIFYSGNEPAKDDYTPECIVPPANVMMTYWYLRAENAENFRWNRHLNPKTKPRVKKGKNNADG